MSLTAGRMFFGIEGSIVFVDEDAQSKCDVPVTGTVDDAHALGLHLRTDLASAAGDVAFPLGPHQSVTNRSGPGDIDEGCVGVGVIGKALYPGCLLERELTGDRSRLEFLGQARRFDAPANEQLVTSGCLGDAPR
jgi:hypothetical protein